MVKQFRKVKSRKQGLKILFYGEDGAGKSMSMLTFPKIAIIDTESKLGVYENNNKFNKNIVGVADTVNYYDVIELAEQVIGDTSSFSTFVIDSETNLYESMQVAVMKVEENRAEKNKKNVDDATVSQRGWGKVKLNNARLKNLKAQISALGITIISIAHKKDIIEKVGDKNIKIGEKPDLKEGSKHDYDIVLRFFKEKDLATGEYKFFIEVEKDTTQTLKVGSKIENFSYSIFKDYIEENNSREDIVADYGNAINDNMEDTKEESLNFENTLAEFTSLFKYLKEKDLKNVETITQLLKNRGIDSYKNPAYAEELKEVVKELKTM